MNSKTIKELNADYMWEHGGCKRWIEYNIKRQRHDKEMEKKRIERRERNEEIKEIIKGLFFFLSVFVIIHLLGQFLNSKTWLLFFIPGAWVVLLWIAVGLYYPISKYIEWKKKKIK